MKRMLAVFLGGALLLGGCGRASDPPVQADPTPTGSPTTTRPMEPVMPDAATRQTKAGAIAFAKYYWRLVDYAQSSLDTSGLRQLSASTCSACDGGADSVDQIRGKGGSIRGGTHEVTRVWTPHAASLRSSHSIGVIVRVHVSKQVVASAGALSRNYKAGDDLIPMTLEFGAGGWRVVSWHVES